MRPEDRDAANLWDMLEAARKEMEFIEAAVSRFLAHLARHETEKRDLETLNRRADALNAEANDVLKYQMPLYRRLA